MEIPVTIRTLDGTFKQAVDIPTDMTVGELRDAAQEKANLLSVPCDLLRDRTDQVLRENDTIEDAGIESDDLLILTPRAEGG
ncbi:hypothetical protein E1H12_16275 [Geitlerinema sp. P-1104]|uniref:ubiquitin-like domain-containing protein n=1 Tax=Geitlerinema sp. P-1104 TaxID=2546230 RepID=UPI001476B9F2|nr:ubiquitin-like domain-containing protein [Geitlerinema sp. P-1104]NMG60031.1 hypothetical protein [Geitlerinema sp. P-1104]